MRWQLLAMAIIAASTNTHAVAGNQRHAGHDDNGSCPQCGEACYPTVTAETETKRCWDVETKAICIPRVRFPWEKAGKGKGFSNSECPPPTCGRIKHVNRLMVYEYQCTVCKYTWDPSVSKDIVVRKRAGQDRRVPNLNVPSVPESGSNIPAPASVEAGVQTRQPPWRSAVRVDNSGSQKQSQAAKKQRYLEILTGLVK